MTWQHMNLMVGAAGGVVPWCTTNTMAMVIRMAERRSRAQHPTILPAISRGAYLTFLPVDEFSSVLNDCLSFDEFASEWNDCLSGDGFAPTYVRQTDEWNTFYPIRLAVNQPIRARHTTSHTHAPTTPHSPAKLTTTTHPSDLCFGAKKLVLSLELPAINKCLLAGDTIRAGAPKHCPRGTAQQCAFRLSTTMCINEIHLTMMMMAVPAALHINLLNSVIVDCEAR